MWMKNMLDWHIEARDFDSGLKTCSFLICIIKKKIYFENVSFK